MDYILYIDESGNTGNIELRENLTWNYGTQTHFALGSFYIKEESVSDIEKSIISILHKYDEKLGTENELKSKANYKFKNNLLEDITKLLINNNVGYYFDIANKKFKVIMTLVDYCVYPYYIIPEANRATKIEMANFLYYRLPAEQIKVFIDLCQRKHSEEICVNRLIELLNKLHEFLMKNKKDNKIREAIDFINDYENKGVRVHNLIPIKDFNNKGTEESFLPNVDAYNNLVGSIYKFGLSRKDSISIFHDEQKQFSNVLKCWRNYLKKNQSIRIKETKFLVSKNNILIQIADFFTGTIIRLFRKIIECEPLSRNNRDMIKILKTIL